MSRIKFSEGVPMKSVTGNNGLRTNEWIKLPFAGAVRIIENKDGTNVFVPDDNSYCLMTLGVKNDKEEVKVNVFGNQLKDFLDRSNLKDYYEVKNEKFYLKSFENLECEHTVNHTVIVFKELVEA